MTKTHIHAPICACLIALALLSSPSCSKDTPAAIDETWKSKNEKIYSDLAANSAYSSVPSPSNMGQVYYKELKAPTSAEPIYFTDTVKVYYTGSLITDSIFDSAEPPYDAPVIFSVSSLCDGFATALQYMKKGSRWEIWMPQELGYGSAGSKNSAGKVIIPPYSTLKFEVEVVGIKRSGKWL
ncbi:MAG: FKBP-type peptidyl-prolyl cis-trans isomerase [Tannerellaceae bacterium]|jgi:peptidylprolyl isomerase/FKBP-type peptidyl-prolyl cis-trans isomerase FklB|nr:FKBP-type peptidyl-prolyl cis-trans isomerase [Tannerellaceae bacterium]